MGRGMPPGGPPGGMPPNLRGPPPGMMRGGNDFQKFETSRNSCWDLQ